MNDRQQPKKRKTTYMDQRIFKDPVHGLIELDPLLVKIIDTPEFQRLRCIKQLGMCYFVYPGACHNRFEHSLGVCHLAGMFVEELKRKQPELNIKDTDILCIKIAGLCHDLGHGPFSHLFDTSVVPDSLKGPTGEGDVDAFKHHEERSRLILEHLIKENKLEKCFEDQELGNEQRKFIGHLITNSLDEKKKHIEGKWKGKEFLFEIVANKDTGIDVDKWDYFARDCHMLGISNNFDHMRCMKLARVIKTDTGMRICFRDKEVFNLYEMFHTRYTLHLRAYQHKTVKVIEKMTADVLLKASSHLKFGKGQMTMRKIIRTADCAAFCLLTDEIFSTISNSTDPNLDDVRCLLEDIKKRNLYKFIGETRITFDQEMEEGFENQVQELGSEDRTEVLRIKLDYGKKNANPIDSVMFYSKMNPNKAIKIKKEEVSYLIPQHMYEKHLLLVYKGDDSEKKEELKKKFTGWCTDHGYPIPNN